MDWSTWRLPQHVRAMLDRAPSVLTASSVDDLVELAVRDAGPDGQHEVAYDLPTGERVVEAHAHRVRNGVSANYTEPYMRRRDPDCMVIGDELPTNKPTYLERFGKPFDDTRDETFAWLASQPLAMFPFIAGGGQEGLPALAIVPDNAGFFALGLAMLQGITAPEDLPEDFEPRAIIYGAPPFRHTHFDGRQVVVHARSEGMHELFSYNLYPGPSAKKGIYGVLLNIGEQDGWTTAHCSTVRVTTPYDNHIVFMHEGASGGGKSEMLEHVHRQSDGRLLLGHNTITDERRHLTLPRACELAPVTDDMALCPPRIQSHEGSVHKLTLTDAEDAWFVRVNHITKYGIDPHLEHTCIHPDRDLLFLNIDSSPGASALIWEHIHDEPGTPCPNPRVVIPRASIPNVVDGEVTVDVRSMGVRTPPCTALKPTYGILGLFHILPPSLAWLWRLVAPRGHANPSIVDTGGLSSEGVGSFWPFATGRRVDQANILYDQIMSTPDTLFTLVPNQHVGCWATSFMPQWLMREYLARRGANPFRPDTLEPARCNVLGYALKGLQIEGTVIPHWFLRPHTQPEVGEQGYDEGAKILTDFFHKELEQYRTDPDLHPGGLKIIEACLDGAHTEEYERLSEELGTYSGDTDANRRLLGATL
ncbi:MAG: DUF4914 family protein [Phycisphaerales bacterium]